MTLLNKMIMRLPMETVVIGFDPGSTESRVFDGENVYALASLMAKQPVAGKTLSFNEPDSPNNSQEEGSTARVQRHKDGNTFLLGCGAQKEFSCRSLADGPKDSPDVQLMLDTLLALKAVKAGSKKIIAQVVTQCPVTEWLTDVVPTSIKRLLDGNREIYLNCEKITVEVEVLEVNPEAVAALYYLASTRQLPKGKIYKVLDFGGRTLDAVYMREGRLIPEYSVHFESGSEVYVVDAVANFLKRKGTLAPDRGRIREAISSGSMEYIQDSMAVINFKDQVSEAEEEYSARKLSELSGLWRGIPADAVVITGGGVTSSIARSLLRDYPKAVIVEPDLARLANVYGLYHQALKMTKKRAKAVASA
jgi:hypothetical protein